MGITSRRTFLGHLGRGLLLASAGPSLALERALAGWLDEAADASRLHFGPLEPLAARMQDSDPEALLPHVVEALRAGTSLREVIAAAALANARTFGGQDYIGYHAFMALVPALEMSAELEGRERALPVLKVLYRNTARMRDFGGSSSEVLHGLDGSELGADAAAMRRAMLAGDLAAAERAFGGFSQRTPGEALAALQHSVLYDVTDVHRTVLAWRAWDLRRLCGEQHGHTLLRQSLRYCVDVEAQRRRRDATAPRLRAFLPELLEETGLERREPGGRSLDAGALATLAATLFSASSEDAARAAAAALADGVAPGDVGEALSIAATRLLLCDPGRASAEAGKPAGSVHGASTGVHASDAAAAWRQLARASAPRDGLVALVVAAYHTGGQSQRVGKAPLAHARELEELRSAPAREQPLRALAAAIEASDQPRAMAAAELHDESGGAPGPLLAVLLRYAVRADGALHAEKYYRTISEVVASGRPAFRRDHLKALARVSASSFGFEADGLAQARELLGA